MCRQSQYAPGQQANKTGEQAKTAIGREQPRDQEYCHAFADISAGFFEHPGRLQRLELSEHPLQQDVRESDHGVERRAELM